MKPTLSNNFRRNDRDHGSGFPLVHCNYHAATMPNFQGRCARSGSPSFRTISGEYFRNEARGEFQLEVVAFAALVITAAIPILSNLHALANFLRAIGSL
jgi:hypothetical protein